jgi:hypothetical protein
MNAWRIADADVTALQINLYLTVYNDRNRKLERATAPPLGRAASGMPGLHCTRDWWQKVAAAAAASVGQYLASMTSPIWRR